VGTTAVHRASEMARFFNRIPRAQDLIPGVATRTPLGGLSCPYSSRHVAVPPDEDPSLHDPFRPIGAQGVREDRAGESCADARCGDADPWSWRDSLTTDYWNPPTSESQHTRQRIFAVIVAFILAAILAQAGW